MQLRRVLRLVQLTFSLKWVYSSFPDQEDPQSLCHCSTCSAHTINHGCLGFLWVHRSKVTWSGNTRVRMSREGDTFAIHWKSTTVQCWWLGHRKTQEMFILKNCRDYSSLAVGNVPDHILIKLFPDNRTKQPHLFRNAAFSGALSTDLEKQKAAPVPPPETNQQSRSNLPS